MLCAIQEWKRMVFHGKKATGPKWLQWSVMYISLNQNHHLLLFSNKTYHFLMLQWLLHFFKVNNFLKNKSICIYFDDLYCVDQTFSPNQYTASRGGRNWGQNECRISYTCPRITHKVHVFWGQNHENLVHPEKGVAIPSLHRLHVIGWTSNCEQSIMRSVWNWHQLQLFTGILGFGACSTRKSTNSLKFGNIFAKKKRCAIGNKQIKNDKW